MEATLENLQPLLQDVDVQGRTVSVTFRCPRSGMVVQSQHSVRQETGLSSQVGRSLKRSLMYGLRSSIAGLVRSVFGHGMLGRTASSMTYQMMNEATRGQGGQTRLRKKEVDAAVVEAFVRVKPRFTWTDQGWIAAEAARASMSPFQRLVAEHPITHAYDRDVLARMLVEMARADGRLAPQEQAWLTEILPADSSVQALAQRPPLSPQELGQTSGNVRETLLAMAWVMALIDEDLDVNEHALLTNWARQLGQGEGHSARTAAQGHVLDQALERMHAWGGHDPFARQQLFDLASRLGMSQDEALQAEAAFQRRSS